MAAARAPGTPSCQLTRISHWQPQAPTANWLDVLGTEGQGLLRLWSLGQHARVQILAVTHAHRGHLPTDMQHTHAQNTHTDVCTYRHAHVHLHKHTHTAHPVPQPRPPQEPQQEVLPGSMFLHHLMPVRWELALCQACTGHKDAVRSKGRALESVVHGTARGWQFCPEHDSPTSLPAAVQATVPLA